MIAPGYRPGRLELAVQVAAIVRAFRCDRADAIWRHRSVEPLPGRGVKLLRRLRLVPPPVTYRAYEPVDANGFRRPAPMTARYAGERRTPILGNGRDLRHDLADTIARVRRGNAALADAIEARLMLPARCWR